MITGYSYNQLNHANNSRRVKLQIISDVIQVDFALEVGQWTTEDILASEQESHHQVLAAELARRIALGDEPKRCGRMHYPGNNPENGPAERCVLAVGHEELEMEHEGASQFCCHDCGEVGTASRRGYLCEPCKKAEADRVAASWYTNKSGERVRCRIAEFNDTTDDPILVESGISGEHAEVLAKQDRRDGCPLCIEAMMP